MIKYAVYPDLYHHEYKISCLRSRWKRETCKRAYEIEREVPFEMHDVWHNNNVVFRGRLLIQATETLDPPCPHSIFEISKSLSQMVATAPVTVSKISIKC